MLSVIILFPRFKINIPPDGNFALLLGGKSGHTHKRVLAKVSCSKTFSLHSNRAAHHHDIPRKGEREREMIYRHHHRRHRTSGIHRDFVEIFGPHDCGTYYSKRKDHIEREKRYYSSVFISCGFSEESSREKKRENQKRMALSQYTSNKMDSFVFRKNKGLLLSVFDAVLLILGIYYILRFKKKKLDCLDVYEVLCDAE